MLNQNFADSGIPRVSQIVRDLVLVQRRASKKLGADMAWIDVTREATTAFTRNSGARRF